MKFLNKLMLSLMIIMLVNSALAMEMEDDRQDELNRRLRAAAGMTASLYINHDLNEVINLLAQGANPDYKFYSNKEPILITAVKGYAIYSNDTTLQIIKELLENCKNKNAQDADGNTALYYAIENNWLPVVKLLINFNADPYVENNQNISAYDLLLVWIATVAIAQDPDGILPELEQIKNSTEIR